ncbi:MAG TPA: hypothetical protein VKB80_27910 [Kofleriaceae bacterium]|nr:hypothetical protein [Kofleriaceae bacterium]
MKSRDPLDGLDAIEWGAIEHAYGAADDVPAMLRALRSPRAGERREALRGLGLTIIHQNTHWPGSIQAAPFVAALAVDGETPDRPGVLRFLAELYGNAWRAHVCDPRLFPDVAALPIEDPWRRTREAIDERIAEVEALLDGDDEVAAAAGFALAWSTDASPRLVERLRNRAAAADARAAASALLALGTLAARRLIPADRVAALAEERLAGDEPAPRGAAAVALAWLGGGDEARVLDALEAAAAWPAWCDSIGWPDHLRDVPLAWLARTGPLARRSTLDLVLHELAGALDGPRAKMVAGWLLDALFPVGGRRDLLPEDLSPPERRVVAALAESGALWSTWHDLLAGRGLPCDQDRLLRWLGRRSPDALETRIIYRRADGGRHLWPAWKILLDGARDPGRADRALDALAAGLSPIQVAWLAAWHTFEPAAHWGDVPPGEDRRMVAALASRVLGDDSLLDLRPRAHDLRDHIEPDLGRIDVFLRASVDGLAACQGGRVPEPAGDELLAEAIAGAAQARPLSLAVDLLPPERRADVIAGAFARTARRSLWRVNGRAAGAAPAAGAWLFLDALTPLGSRAIDVVGAAVRRLGGDGVPRGAIIRWLAALPAALRAGPAAVAIGGHDPFANLARIADALAAGVPVPAAELRWEMHLRVREGVAIVSGRREEGPLLPMSPCPLCAQLHRELALHAGSIGDGAAGGIIVPDGAAPAGEREVAELRAPDWPDPIAIDRSSAFDAAGIDPALAAPLHSAARRAISSGALAARELESARSCVEIAALDQLARHIRADLAALLA